MTTHRSSIFAFARSYLFRVAPLWSVLFVFLAIGCGGRSDDGSLPTFGDASTRADAARDGARTDAPVATSDAPTSSDAPTNGDAFPVFDTGVFRDGGLDASVEGGRDAVADVRIDATADVRLDVATDVRIDTGLDGGVFDAGPDAAPVVLVSVAVSPPSSVIAIGTKQQLTVTGTYSDRTTADLTTSAAFRTDTASVATVAASGLVTGVTAGGATLTASVNGVTGTAKVTVSAAAVTSIAITPQNANTGVGGTVNYVATGTLNDGTHQDLTSSGTWSSSVPAVASIDATGAARGVGAGQTTISFVGQSITATSTLQVTPANLVSIAITPISPTLGIGVTQAFQATGTYADASIADLTATVTWQSSDTNVLRLETTGAGTALQAGTSIVTATLGAIVGTTTVTVTPAKLVTIAVTPDVSTIAVKGTVQLKAVGTYDDNTTVDLTTSALWTVDRATTAFVSNAADSAGLVTGLAAGPAVVTATLGTLSGAAKITVTSAPLVSIAVTPVGSTIATGAQVSMKATGNYGDGSTVDLTATATWSVDSTAIATISNAAGSNGQATGVSAGSTAVHATLGGIIGTTQLIVSATALSSITVTPANSTLALNVKQAMIATGHYGDGTTSDLTATAVWTTADSAVAGVSNASGAQGQLTAAGAGTTTVTATSLGVSGSTSVTVTAPMLSQIVVSPITSTSTIGQRPQFTATAIYNNGTQQNVTGRATWVSSNTMVATINRTGQTTTVAAGTTTIQATFQNLTGSATLTVGTAVVVSITVTPIAPSMAAGTAQQFAAVAIYNDNTSQTITNQATWASTVPAVAGVTTGGGGGPGGGGARGRVTALTMGTAQIQATYQGITGSTTVTVTTAVPISISLTPPDVTLAPGATRQFAAAAIYSDGSSRDVTGQATWTSTAPAVAGVTTGGGGPGGGGGRGLVTAIAGGTTTIGASFSGLTGTASVTVTTATIASVQLTPIATSVAKGLPVKFTATVLYNDNTSQDITAAATWVSSNPAVVGISDSGGSKGQASALAKGTVTISATYKGTTGTTTLTVNEATLTTIQVTPFAPILPIGYITQSQATGIYSDNTAQDLTALATWTSSAPTVAAVSDSGATKGRVTTLTSGTTNIQATYQGVTGTVGVTVTTATLTSIAVSPASPTIAVQGTQQFTAQGNFSDGSHLDLTTLVTWLSSEPTTANVSNASGSQGQAKGIAAGPAVTITATRDTVFGTATLTVQ